MEEIVREEQTAPEGPGFRVRMMRLFVGVLVLALAATTLYLLAERNSRFYYLAQEGSRLMVYRGAWLPSGKRPYLPEDPHTASIYAPIDIPAGSAPIVEQRFEERQDLDRALFEILAGMASERIRSEDESRMKEGFALVDRAGRLPGITGDQAKALRGMRAELSFFEGRSHLERALVELRQAREKLELATEASSSRGPAATSLLRAISPATEVLGRALQRSHGWETPELRPLVQEETIEMPVEEEEVEEAPDAPDAEAAEAEEAIQAEEAPEEALR